MTDESPAAPPRARSTRLVVGWHEWLALPELGIERIAAKLDTGARTSALHARDIVRIEENGVAFAEFTAPLLRHQKNFESWHKGGVRRVRARLVDERIVRSSNGDEEHRWVVGTTFSLGGLLFESELSLTNRTGMRFPMLVGRTALRRRFLVDPARGHLTARPRSERATSPRR